MRPIDGDALEKYLSDAEIEAIRQRKYVFANALNTICGNVRNFPTIEPEQSRIEKELHGLTPDEQYAFLDTLMHKKSVGWNSRALYVKAWLAGEED